MRSLTSFALIGLLQMILATTAGAETQAAPTSKPAAAKGPRVVNVRITPAPAPRPALKYTLLPNSIDQTPGNADSLLHLLAELTTDTENNKAFDPYRDKLAGWLDLPADKLPQQDVLTVIGQFTSPLHYAELAARREYCEWDLPVRSEGMSLVLPFLVHHRTVGRVLALRIRMAVAEGRYADAAADLQTGFSLSKQVGGGPTLIHSLVGAAISAMMTREIEQWSGKAGSPNLYWALAALPQPMIDGRRGLQFEQRWQLIEMPELRTLDTTVLTQQQADALVNRIAGLIQSPTVWKSPGSAATVIKEDYPAAREALTNANREEKRIPEGQKTVHKIVKQFVAASQTEGLIAAMPQAQVVLLQRFSEFEPIRDDYFKWFGIPYPQSCDGLQAMERQLDRARSESKGRNPFLELLPSLSRAHFILARTDREIAALRCIEAIRMHAAAYDGKLPATLAEITEVPVPSDPVTGKPFVYESHGDTATMTGVIPDQESPDYVRYELTTK